MIESQPYRKNKINLADYDYQKDIRNRLMLAQLTEKEREVLEEILFNSLQFPVSRLAGELDMEESELRVLLDRFAETGLLDFDDETVRVDKEMRKYFEAQISKFEDDFTPGMDFLQSLLKKVPIDVLPNWYPIPRTSNNIFASLVEKYLETPQTFQRYVAELSFTDPVMQSIARDVMNAPKYRISSKEVCEKYTLSQEKFEEYMLHLEFNFVCCLVYEKQGDEWAEVVTLFQEWKDYLSFLKETKPQAIDSLGAIRRSRPHDFSFVEDMSTLLSLAHHQPIPLITESQWVPQEEVESLLAEACKEFNLSSTEGRIHFKSYMGHVIQKLLMLRLAYIDNKQLKVHEEAHEWLTLPIEKRSLAAYKATLSVYDFTTFPSEICTERNIREIEKSIARIIGSGWVYFDDFMKGVIAPISEESKMVLKKAGRYWKYTIPNYTDDERRLIRLVILEWLFEAGIVATGVHNERTCFIVTPLGQSMFG